MPHKQRRKQQPQNQLLSGADLRKLNDALLTIEDRKALKQVVWDGLLIPRHTALHPKQERLPSATARGAIEKIWQAYNQRLGWKVFIGQVQDALQDETSITFHYNTILPHVQNFIQDKFLAEILRRGLMDGRSVVLRQTMKLKGLEDRQLNDEEMKELNSFLETTTLREFNMFVEAHKKKHGSL
jgi:hypothetical protein